MTARRIALAIVFGLLALEGGLSFALRYALGAYDQALPFVHLATGLVGLALSWRERPQRLYGAVFGAAYLALALAGALGRLHLAWLPLEGQDHALHAAVGLFAAAFSLGRMRPPPKRKAKPRKR